MSGAGAHFHIKADVGLHDAIAAESDLPAREFQGFDIPYTERVGREGLTDVVLYLKQYDVCFGVFGKSFNQLFFISFCVYLVIVRDKSDVGIGVLYCHVAAARQSSLGSGIHADRTAVDEFLFFAVAVALVHYDCPSLEF